jgi:hypothetical protein
MSMRAGVICLDCKAWAPDVGDGGFLGGPAIEVSEQWSSDDLDMPSFGYFYEALVALAIRPYDLETFRAWLIEHTAHRIAPLWDLDDVEGSILDPGDQALVELMFQQLGIDQYRAARSRREKRSSVV